MDHDLTIAKPLGPDDLKRDDFVVSLFVLTEHLTLAEYFGLDPWSCRGVVRTRWLPCADIGVPMRIVEVCVPFVLVEKVDGSHATIDTRRVRLARVSSRYGKRAFKRLKPKDAPPDGHTRPG